MRVGTWDSFTHKKERGNFFVEERDGSSLSASESDELEASPKLWKQQWWQRERLGLLWTGTGLLWQWIEGEAAVQGRERKKNFEFMFYEIMGGLNPETVGGCEIF